MLTTKSSSFKKYGYVLEGDFSDVVEFLKKKAPMPLEKTLYVRDDVLMHDLKSFSQIKEEVFGLSPMESGYCNGYNSKLNCLEYHASCEVNVAMNDLVLLLATPKDIKDGVIDSKDVKAFKIKKGQAIVLYPYILHFAPCQVTSKGFKCAVFLPDGTNRELEVKPSDKRLWKENKWLFAHQDTIQAKNGAYIGIVGDNIEVPCR